MKSLEKVVNFFNPAKDLDHFESKKYRRLVKSDKSEEINQATLYLFQKIPVNIPKHILRGAVPGIMGGFIFSLIKENPNLTVYGAILGGTLDWLQYGARITIKLAKCYF